MVLTNMLIDVIYQNKRTELAQPRNNAIKGSTHTVRLLNYKVHLSKAKSPKSSLIFHFETLDVIEVVILHV
jgi:hypothetical protein